MSTTAARLLVLTTAGLMACGEQVPAPSSPPAPSLPSVQKAPDPEPDPDRRFAGALTGHRERLTAADLQGITQYGALRVITRNNSTSYYLHRGQEAGFHYEIAKLFADQGHTVIVATMSLFHEIHAWNRDNLPGYFEIWIEVDLPTLRSRDARSLYSRAANHETNHVAGIDLQYDRPTNPDWIVQNDGSEENFKDQAQHILNQHKTELIES